MVDRTALLTLNRPEVRNALSTELLRRLRDEVAAADADDAVDVIVITGADPAFCAGLDLNELGSTGSNLVRDRPTDTSDSSEPAFVGFWATTAKPLIGAVNGPAVTGGLEIALQCDFLVASDHARFADTHARVGVLPGGGLSVLLPQAVGVRLAREMSVTGRFVRADEALRAGLVNHVVPHHDLLPFTCALAAEIAGNDQWGVRALLDEYRQTSTTTVGEGLRIEARIARDQHRGVDPSEVARRRDDIVERGSRLSRD